MSSAADPPREPSANPYQSPRSLDEDRVQADPLAASGWTALEARGEVSLRDVRRAGIDNVGGPVGCLAWCAALAFLVFLVGIFPVVCLMVASRSLDWRGVIAWSCFLLILLAVVIGASLREVIGWICVDHLWRTNQGMFAYRERTITADGILTRSADQEERASWDDFQGCRTQRELVVLQYSRQAIRRRRAARKGQKGRWIWMLSRPDCCEIFPRSHFGDPGQWEAFVALVKEPQWQAFVASAKSKARKA